MSSRQLARRAELNRAAHRPVTLEKATGPNCRESGASFSGNRSLSLVTQTWPTGTLEEEEQRGRGVKPRWQRAACTRAPDVFYERRSGAYRKSTSPGRSLTISSPSRAVTRRTSSSGGAESGLARTTTSPRNTVLHSNTEQRVSEGASFGSARRCMPA